VQVNIGKASLVDLALQQARRVCVPRILPFLCPGR
jgi:hypothetical protein